jgi:hypothetical protein
MRPPREHFEADDAIVLQIDQRLVMRLHLAIADSEMKVTFDHVALAGLRVQFGVEEAEGRARFDLGAVQRNIGLAPDFAGGLAILRYQRNADTGADLMADGAGCDRFVELGEDAQGDARRLLGAHQLRREHGELVAADAGDRITLADRASQAQGHRDQNLIAYPVPVKVVDALEAV